jgi:hypothetical protein
MWYGPLLITFRNNTDKAIKMKPGDPFVTLLFARVRTSTKSPHNKPSHREDILLGQLNQQTNAYVNKITGVLTDKAAKESFASRVSAANQPMFAKVAASIRNKNREERWRLILQSALFITIIILSFLSFIWDYISPVFRGIPYDSKVLAAQIGGVIASLTALWAMHRTSS